MINDITLDGLDDNDQLEGFAFEGAMRTILDSLREFRVTTGNYDAGSGRSSGAQVNMVTKRHQRLPWCVYNAASRTLPLRMIGSTSSQNLRTISPTFPGLVSPQYFWCQCRWPDPERSGLLFIARYEGQRTADTTQQTRTVPTQSLREGFLTAAPLRPGQ